jgi:hypothetical protein
MEELFRKTKEIDGYLISNLGNVYSEKSMRMLKPQNQKDGYLSVTIGGKTRRIHLLVWDNFGDGTKINFPNVIIDHIDKNPKNNNIKNLRVSDIRNNAHNQKNNVEDVCIYEIKNKFKLSIRFEKKLYYFGLFDSRNDAIEIKKAAFKILSDNLDFIDFYNNNRKIRRKNNV